MSDIVRFPRANSRQYDVLNIADESLAELGIKPGDEFVVSVGEFLPGDFHAIETVGGLRVKKLSHRPANLYGRVLPPPAPTAAELPPFKAGSFHWRADASGSIVELGQVDAESLLGRPASQLYGYGCLDAVAPEDRAKVAVAWGQAVLHGGVYQASFIAQRPDGSRIPLAVSAVPSANARGEIEGWAGLTQPGAVIMVA